jgi:hypothetical protein
MEVMEVMAGLAAITSYPAAMSAIMQMCTARSIPYGKEPTP